MTMCRRFNGRPVVRVIATMPADLVQALDMLLQRQPDAERQCRAEYMRVAVAERVGRDLMICGATVAEANPRPPDAD